MPFLRKVSPCRSHHHLHPSLIRVFVPLDQRSENESSGSRLLAELSFSDRWSRGTKTLGTRLITLNTDLRIFNYGDLNQSPAARESLSQSARHENQSRVDSTSCFIVYPGVFPVMDYTRRLHLKDFLGWSYIKRQGFTITWSRRIEKFVN